MAILARITRQYPVVTLTIGIGLAVAGLSLAGQPSAGRWVATVYVAAFIAWTSWGMLRDILRGHFGLDILAVVAMIATLAVGEYVASLIVVLMLSGGEALEDIAAQRARRDLSALQVLRGVNGLAQLGGVVRIGGIAGFLQAGGKRLDRAGLLAGLGVAWRLGDEAGVVAERRFI